MIDAAVERLRAGDVVGMPTETVYGLAGDARSEAAVARIFALKGRPSTNPLIVHVASVDVAARYVEMNERAARLFARFAPGPLTIVLPRRTGAGPQIATRVSAGLSTIGIRIPTHPIALALLRAFDGPLAAPSANRSNHVSPTTAEHVRAEFGDEVLVLDGGPCEVGIESTVLDLSGGEPTILRPGAVTRAMIEAEIGPVAAFAGHVAASTVAISPGQQEKHYSPRAPAWRFEARDLPMIAARLAEMHHGRAGRATRFAAIVMDSLPTGWSADRFQIVRSLGSAPASVSRSLYAALRDVDATEPHAIFIQMPDRATGAANVADWDAVRDRITRATRPVEEWLRDPN